MSKRSMEPNSSSSPPTEGEDYSPDTGCSSSSQSPINDKSFNSGSCGQMKTKKPQKSPSANGRNSSVDLKHKEHIPVASTSTQLQSELGNIIKREIEEMEDAVEQNGLTDSTQLGVDCSISAVGGQAQLIVRRSKRQRVSVKVKDSEDPKPLHSKQPTKKVCVSKPHEKYFEGCLVMAYGTYCLNGNRYPYWPGMIRRAGTVGKKHRDYFRICRGKIWFYIQYFTNPIMSCWRKPWNIRLFNAAKPNQCHFSDPEFVAEFEEGVRIAKAASTFTVEDRLTKFTLPAGASTTSFLKAEEEWKSHAPSDGSDAQLENNPATPSQGNRGIFADSVIQEGGVSTPPTDANVESCSEPAAQNEIAPAPLVNGNGEACPDSVEIMMKKRISEYQKKLRDECNREKDEEIKRLSTDKATLELTVKNQAKVISDLQETLEKEKQETLKYQREMDEEKQEKMKYKKELETRTAVFDKMFPDS